MNELNRKLLGGGLISGQALFTTAGSHTWTAPPGVTSVCVVCVGAGGWGNFQAAGGGGGLGWKNNISVVPGNSYTVVVGSAYWGANSGFTHPASYFISTGTVAGYSGNGAVYPTPTSTGGSGGSFVGDGGGSGGNGGDGTTGATAGGGGGAGGYAGNGGSGASWGGGNGSSGAGGGAGGGAEDAGSTTSAGGGVGVLGQGSSGSGGTTSGTRGGSGGSGGTDGFSIGGTYGGGATGGTSSLNGGGAVRIIWGPGRSFPSTNTGDF